jgi:hypothetical protein
VKPLTKAALAAGVTAIGIILVTKKSKAQSGAPAIDPAYGEQTRVALAVPSGWRRVTGSEVAALPELGVTANALRNTSGFTSMQYGTLSPFVASDGNTYATWIEQHYHPPGGDLRPWGYHHGVTLLAQAGLS